MAFQNTRPGEEAPVTTERSDGHGKTTTHPAFGQIGVSRVSGHTTLYDSDFDHNAFMTIRISTSELNRNLARDWHYAKGEIIEVALSESQWATFVSSPNVGSGVPCTIQHIKGERMPGIALPDREPQFTAEMNETTQEAIDSIEALKAAIAVAGLSAKKSGELTQHANHAIMQLRSNVPFVAKSFSEHMERTVEKAKGEIHGYMNGAIQRAGIQALTGGELPLEIEGPKAGGE